MINPLNIKVIPDNAFIKYVLRFSSNVNPKIDDIYDTIAPMIKFVLRLKIMDAAFPRSISIKFMIHLLL